MERRRGYRLSFRPTALVDELADYTRRELDFRREARAASTVARFFRPEDGVVVPAVHADLSTARVLTTELIIGIRPAPRAELQAAGLDADRLLEVGARAVLRQVFELGLFHADPHPGNLLLLAGDRVCFLDFGLSGRLERRERIRMALLLYALATRDFDVAADQLLHVAGRAPDADVRGFRAALAEVAEEWYDGSTESGSIARLLLQELALGGRYGIRFPRELMLLARALVHFEATAALVDPSLTFADLLRPLVPELRKMVTGQATDLGRLWSEHRLDYLALMLELPELLPHLRDALAGGSAPNATPASSRATVRSLAAAAAVGAVAARLTRRSVWQSSVRAAGA